MERALGYGFSQSTWFSRDYLSLMGGLQTQELIPICEVYAENMEQVMHLPRAMAGIALSAAVLGRSVTAWPPQSLDFQEEMILEDGSVSAEVMARMIHLVGLSRKKAPQELLDIGAKIIEAICQGEDDMGDLQPIRRGISSLYYSILLGSYAAFEAFAVDLWVEAVNTNPDFAFDVIKKMDDRLIPLSHIKRHKFDLTRSMGNILVETNKVNFLNLWDIRSAYKSLIGASEDIFNDNPDLTRLEKTRHLIAHRGGLVDEKYAKAMIGMDNPPDLTPGSYVEFHGEHVSDLVSAAVRVAVALAKLTDSKMPGFSAQ